MPEDGFKICLVIHIVACNFQSHLMILDKNLETELSNYLPKIVIPVKQYVITLKLIYKVHEQINKK